MPPIRPRGTDYFTPKGCSFVTFTATVQVADSIAVSIADSKRSANHDHRDLQRTGKPAGPGYAIASADPRDDDFGDR